MKGRTPALASQGRDVDGCAPPANPPELLGVGLRPHKERTMREHPRERVSLAPESGGEGVRRDDVGRGRSGRHGRRGRRRCGPLRGRREPPLEVVRRVVRLDHDDGARYGLVLRVRGAGDAKDARPRVMHGRIGNRKARDLVDGHEQGFVSPPHVGHAERIGRGQPQVDVDPVTAAHHASRRGSTYLRDDA